MLAPTYFISQITPIMLLLLSKSQPLTLDYDLVLGAKLEAAASIKKHCRSHPAAKQGRPGGLFYQDSSHSQSRISLSSGSSRLGYILLVVDGDLWPSDLSISYTGILLALAILQNRGKGTWLD